MRTIATTVLLLGIVGAFVAGCNDAAADRSAPDGQSACDQAFAQAIAIDPGADTISAIDGAIAGCQSLEAWVDAAQRFPDALDGQDPDLIAGERCAASTELAHTAVCTDLQMTALPTATAATPGSD
jgi:hypothetical protein